MFSVSFFIKYILLSKNNTELKIACLVRNNNYFILLKRLTITPELEFMEAVGQDHHAD